MSDVASAVMNNKVVNGNDDDERDTQEPDGSAPNSPADDSVSDKDEKESKKSKKAPGDDVPPKQPRQLSISVRSLVFGLVVIGWAVSLGVVLWLYYGARSEVKQDETAAENNAHAEQLALDYSVGAARIDFQSLDKWKTDLVKGTSQDLTDKLNNAAGSMEQILVPLEWKSSASPLAAKVRSVDKGVYVVDAFVGVDTKTKQSPDGLQSTATYSVTIDSNDDWKITDVGGPGALMGEK